MIQDQFQELEEQALSGGLRTDEDSEVGEGYVRAANWADVLQDEGCARLSHATFQLYRNKAIVPVSTYSELMELIFEVRDAEEGGFYSRARGHGIFAEGDSWDELRKHVIEAVGLHFEDAEEKPRLVQMHYVRDEAIFLEAD